MVYEKEYMPMYIAKIHSPDFRKSSLAAVRVIVVNT
jgi:hypothetical protein